MTRIQTVKRAEGHMETTERRAFFLNVESRIIPNIMPQVPYKTLVPDTSTRLESGSKRFRPPHHSCKVPGSWVVATSGLVSAPKKAMRIVILGMLAALDL